jgi:hypothetical protein
MPGISAYNEHKRDEVIIPLIVSIGRIRFNIWALDASKNHLLRSSQEIFSKNCYQSV